MSKNIESHLVENRLFKPSKEFSKKARIQSMAQYRAMWEESVKKPEKFWAREAAELTWNKKWTKVLDWKVPFAKWFVGGKINVAENCLDRHIAGDRKTKAAIIWEGEPGEKRVITYQQLHRDVCTGSPAIRNPTGKLVSPPNVAVRTTAGASEPVLSAKPISSRFGYCQRQFMLGIQRLHLSSSTSPAACRKPWRCCTATR